MICGKGGGDGSGPDPGQCPAAPGSGWHHRANVTAGRGIVERLGIDGSICDQQDWAMLLRHCAEPNQNRWNGASQHVPNAGFAEMIFLHEGTPRWLRKGAGVAPHNPSALAAASSRDLKKLAHEFSRKGCAGCGAMAAGGPPSAADRAASTAANHCAAAVAADTASIVRVFIAAFAPP